VVRLAAAKAMRVVIDDFEFSVEELEPYLNQVFWSYCEHSELGLHDSPYDSAHYS
jgi:hypothetical protein